MRPPRLVLVLLVLLAVLCAEGVQGKTVKRSSAVKEKRSVRKKKSVKSDGGDISFVKTTRLKTGLDLKRTGFLPPIAKKAQKTIVNSRIFRLFVEEKIFESLIGMVAWRVAFQWSKEPWATKRARLLFTGYMLTYFGLLLYVRYAVLQKEDTRLVKVSTMPGALAGVLDMAKKLQKGKGLIIPEFSPLQKEMTYKEYDLSHIVSSLNRLTLFLAAMTFLHFRMKNVSMILYWGILGPLTLLRDPLFQLHILGMEETGIRERPFGPKETPEAEAAADEAASTAEEANKLELQPEVQEEEAEAETEEVLEEEVDVEETVVESVEEEEGDVEGDGEAEGEEAAEEDQEIGGEEADEAEGEEEVDVFEDAEEGPDDDVAETEDADGDEEAAEDMLEGAEGEAGEEDGPGSFHVEEQEDDEELEGGEEVPIGADDEYDEYDLPGDDEGEAEECAEDDAPDS